MEDIINLIAIDSSASDISDKIKSELYAKAADKINDLRPHVSNLMFGNENVQNVSDEE